MAVDAARNPPMLLPQMPTRSPSRPSSSAKSTIALNASVTSGPMCRCCSSRVSPCPGPSIRRTAMPRCDEVGGADVVLLTPSVEPAHDDDGRWRFDPERPQQPARQGSTLPGDLNVFDLGIRQRAGSTVRVDQLPVHQKLPLVRVL